jgi:hypothetical protein
LFLPITPSYPDDDIIIIIIMATGGHQGGHHGQSMNHSSFQGSFDSSRLRALSGSQQYSSSILNQLLQQQSAAQRVEASLHQQKLFSSLLLSQASNVAALQQELVASLGHGSSSLQQMLPHHMNRCASQGLVGGLLSRGDQHATTMRRLPGTFTGQNLLPSLNAKQQQHLELIRNSEREDLECQREGGSGVSASPAGQETATQLPCQARGMAADHNSSVRVNVWEVLQKG